MGASRSRAIGALNALSRLRSHNRLPPSTRRTQLFSSSSVRPESGSQFVRSDFNSQPFTGIYEPPGTTAGPLGFTSNVGSPKITPKMLKDYLDNFVIGQERAKKVLSTAVYNHHQRIQELQRQEDEYQELIARKARREMGKHPAEDEYPDQPTTYRQAFAQSTQQTLYEKLQERSPFFKLEKSNVLLLGPSGVGKTLIAKTLAQVLDVPFSMSDCTPLTQAGYIGEDVEVVVQRLLVAANYDVAKAETGIICLDEIDKITSAKVHHGKDVSGEGVQQALLKILEGTTVTIHAKTDRMAPSVRDKDRGTPPPGFPPGAPPNTPMGGPIGLGGPPFPGKTESYTIRTDNILFICTGAFIGLHKHVLDRIAKGSMGFTAPIRASGNNTTKGTHDTTVKIDSTNIDTFKDHLPYWSLSPNSTTPYTHSTNAPLNYDPVEDENVLNVLDLITPEDLQKFGLIPEIIGRIPIHCAVSPLSEDALVRVLTEPRNALLKQYQVLFSLSGIDIRFTSGAIREIAKRAAKVGTGARGLRGVLEGILSESMFEAPGSSTKYILITEEVVVRKMAPIHLARGQGRLFQSLYTKEEEDFAEAEKVKREKKIVGNYRDLLPDNNEEKYRRWSLKILI